ncbi:MAG: sigma 54-interacting transcriptional regulator [Tepidisphaeraceae bacterium]
MKPEDVQNTVGFSLVAPAPGVQQRIRDAFEAIKAGKEQGGVELELRRKDDGRPLWIQWWSKPDPDGVHTRTVIVDITARVLAERERSTLQTQNQALQEALRTLGVATESLRPMIGQSKAMRGVLDKVVRVAPTDATVLVLGETGVGKELVARAIHEGSTRAGKPMIRVNCAALPANLVESELFGHEKGAFSGAIARRAGRLELADGGTLLLDEIGELSVEVQAKLLRALQEKEFERVGGTQTLKVDVRVIASTNRDLRRAVQDGKFREDLFYRLNVFPITVPPLRDRLDDVPLLAEHLLDRCAVRIGRRFESIAPDTLKRLSTYDWPGNVRELENVLERAAILTTGPVLKIDAEVLSPRLDPLAAQELKPAARAAASEANDLKSIERREILAALERSNWIIEGERGAARVLGLHPNTLRSRLKRLGIERG